MRVLPSFRQQLSPRLPAMNVGVPTCVTKQRSRDTALSWVWVIIFQICRSLNCEERLPLLVYSVFWGVSSTEVVLFLINSSTRRNLRLLCFGVTFVISSSRYERTKALGKFVILPNEVHKRRNEKSKSLTNMQKWSYWVSLLMSIWSLLATWMSLDELLMRLQNLIPTLAKLRIYKSFILPQLTYCQTVWHTIVFLFLKKSYSLLHKSGGNLHLNCR